MDIKWNVWTAVTESNKTSDPMFYLASYIFTFFHILPETFAYFRVDFGIAITQIFFDMSVKFWALYYIFINKFGANLSRINKQQDSHSVTAKNRNFRQLIRSAFITTNFLDVIALFYHFFAICASKLKRNPHRIIEQRESNETPVNFTKSTVLNFHTANG